MVNFIIGESGSGKSVHMVECIKKECSENKKVFVIIPEQFSFEYERKLYNELGSTLFNQIYVLSFTRLARMIYDIYGGKSGEYATDIHKTIIMYMAIKEIEKNKSLVHFVKQTGNRAFISEALQIVGDLRRAGVSPSDFASRIISADKKIFDKASDMSVIYSMYDKIMTDMGYRDELSDITEAASIANINEAFAKSAFFVDEFDSFSPDELEMLDIAMAESEEFYITLCMDQNDRSEFSLFSTVNKTLEKLKKISSKYRKEYREICLSSGKRFENEALRHLSSSLFRNTDKYVNSQRAVKIIEAKDFYSEADFVCSYINYLVIERGYKYNEISVSSRQLDDYDFIIRSAMDRYNIPYFIDTEKSVMHTSIILFITSMLDFCSSRKIETETIFRYAKTGLCGVSLEDISSLENYCYKWNVKKNMWSEEFTAADDNIEKIEEIRKTLVEPLLELRNKCKEANVSSICSYIYEFFETQKINEYVENLILLYRESGFTEISAEINRIWNSVIDILDVMVTTLDDEKISMNIFKELFILILKQDKFLNPPQKLDIVSVVSAEKARLNNPRVIIIMGANEGILPYSVKSSGLLNDYDKEAFSKIGIDISKDTSRLLADERLTVYRLMSVASSEVIITYPLSDTSGNARYPSYILPGIEKIFEDNIKSYASDYDILFYSSTPESAYYNYVQRGNENSEKYLALRDALLKIPEYESKIKYLDTVDPKRDHKIEDKELMRRLVSDRMTISATSFQEYNLCHFKFYCHHILKIATRSRKEINLLELGNIVHMCLENIFLHCSNKEEFLRLSDEEIIKYTEKFSKEYKEKNLGGDFGKDARFEKAFEKLIEDTLSLVNHLREELSQSEFVPVRYEFEISERNGVKPFTIKTKDGMEIILKGKIDRIDIFDDGEEKFIRIVDYKTGVQVFNIRNILFGIDMQLLLYLFSVSGKDSPFGDTVPAGILYMPSGKVPLERDEHTPKSDYLNKYYQMSGVLLKEARVLHAMEENIEGVFVPAKLTAEGRKKGTLILDKVRSSCLSRKQFESLREHSARLIRDMAEGVYNGDISASPLNYDKNKNVCEYCEYWDICGNVPRIRQRIVPDDIEELKKSILLEEQE